MRDITFAREVGTQHLLLLLLKSQMVVVSLEKSFFKKLYADSEAKIGGKEYLWQAE